MLHFLPAPVLGTITAALVILHTLFWAISLHIFAFAKLLVPLPGWRQLCTRGMIWLIEKCWTNSNRLVMRLLLNVEWDIRGLTSTSRDEWYFVSSNHQTWVDIFVLLQTFEGRIPFPRFFLKQELLWVPVVGFVAWALDMPFMKRYSREFLKQHPELRGKDLETTRQAIEKFGDVPVSILNFLEGTRFTPAKHARQKSPYKYLLRPKAGGIAFVLGTMGEKFDALLDVTIIYPQGDPNLWEFVSGRLSRIIVLVDKLDIPPQFLGGDYMNDPNFRTQFQAWVSDLWEQKDARIETTLASVRDDERVPV
jgi:1-acyl-sn-glycerol-3-phosphate acyltransferase